MLEVEISVRSERPTILLPTSLIGSSAHGFNDLNAFAKAVSLTIPEIQLQLRLHDYYMGTFLNWSVTRNPHVLRPAFQKCPLITTELRPVSCRIIQDTLHQQHRMKSLQLMVQYICQSIG